MARAQGHEPGEATYLGSSAPPVAAPVWRHRAYIDRPADLAALGVALASARVVAIDAEFVQLRARAEASHRLTLLQFALDDDQDTSYVVDALRLADLAPLQAALGDGNILKLFHGISADARMLATRGLEARHTLDLEAVSRAIFGQRESGLQAMLLRACGVRLDKSLQRADWSRRPLTPAMVAYAARDAEMTSVLYGWLRANYPWAVQLYETPADEPPPPVAEWIRPFIESSRGGRPADLAVLAAGLANNVPAQERDVRAALAVLTRPTQRVRLMRLITDLNLLRLRPDLRPALRAPASEERAGALRALGRLRDVASEAQMRALLTDPVYDVRLAAASALEHLRLRPASPPRLLRRTPTGPTVWTVGDEADARDGTASAAPDDWRSALRARFGIAGEAAAPDDENA